MTNRNLLTEPDPGAIARWTRGGAWLVVRGFPVFAAYVVLLAGSVIGLNEIAERNNSLTLIMGVNALVAIVGMPLCAISGTMFAQHVDRDGSPGKFPKIRLPWRPFVIRLAIWLAVIAYVFAVDASQGVLPSKVGNGKIDDSAAMTVLAGFFVVFPSFQPLLCAFFGSTDVNLTSADHEIAVYNAVRIMTIVVFPVGCFLISLTSVTDSLLLVPVTIAFGLWQVCVAYVAVIELVSGRRQDAPSFLSRPDAAATPA